MPNGIMNSKEILTMSKEYLDKEYLDSKTETSGCDLDQYKYVYPRLMNNHINTGVAGRNELQFIRREIENHTIILEGLKRTMEKISDLDYRRKNFDPIEVNFGQEKFLNSMRTYENMRDSHELIIEYLESKKLEIKAPQQDEGLKPAEVLKNPDETIFKDDFAFTLFDKMKGLYKDNSTPQADYSFLFDIMQKDGFVICTGIKFIEYLSKLDISMTKIDSSKTGNKLKTKLYNAIKENLQKKHGLSTS